MKPSLLGVEPLMPAYGRDYPPEYDELTEADMEDTLRAPAPFTRRASLDDHNAELVHEAWHVGFATGFAVAAIVFITGTALTLWVVL